MTTNNNSIRPKGLSLHSQAPLIKIIDIYGKSVDLIDLLKNYKDIFN